MNWTLKRYHVDQATAQQLAEAIIEFWDGLVLTEVAVEEFQGSFPPDWPGQWRVLSREPWVIWLLDGFKANHGYSWADPHNVALVRNTSPLGIAPRSFITWTACHEVAHIYTGGSSHCSSFPGFCVLSRFADVLAYFTAKQWRKLCPTHRRQLRGGL